ncbi:MAG: nucleotidyltransferase family protein [Sedimentisphaerales bacterium]|nr:nucleotidyltransferase family protein [Sedimentisphaerales bacterium]
MIIDSLRTHANEIRQQFDVASLDIFGSLARGDTHEPGDIDVLVHFHHKTTFDGYMNLKLYLEDLLQMKVDLVTSKALRPIVAKNIAGDLINVA